MPWETPLIEVVVGLLHRNNLFLIAERPQHKPYAGYWEFPGGKVEVGETQEAALRRELQEELGINIKSAEYWCSHPHVYPDKSVLLHLWRVLDFEGDPQGQEGQCLRWATITEMQALKLLEGNWTVIEKIKNDYQSTAKLF